MPVCSARCTGVTPSGVTYEKDGQTVSVEADTVILAAGMKPLTALADSFMGLTEDYFEVGDCVKARTVEWATKEAYYAALNL